MADAAGLGDRIFVDSAGTGNWHIGMPPDHRAQSASLQRGRDISNLQARQIENGDFARFDLILAMDQNNLMELKTMSPTDLQNKIHIFLNFANSIKVSDIPDPYYGEEENFEAALDMIESASSGLLKHISGI